MKKSKVMRSSLRGFTLIEVLLAAMIVALIGGSLYATFAAGFKLDHRIKKTFADLDEGRMVTEQLHRDLGRVVFYDFRGSFPEQKAFRDNGQSLTFVIDDAGQLRWVKYYLDDGQKGRVRSTQLGDATKKNITVSEMITTDSVLRVLIRDEGDFVQFLADGATIAPDKTEILTRRVDEQGWKIAYAATITPRSQVEWKSLWEEDYLPAAVRLTFSLRDDKGQVKEMTRDFILPAGGRNES